MIVDIIKDICYRIFLSPEKYARKIGVKIGDNCLIATRHWSTEPYLVTIGDHVQLTNGVSIHTHGGGNSIRERIPNFDMFGKVVIEDWAYIGAGSQIMPGVTIGRGSIIAAGSIVTKSVPAATVYGGNPARFICTIEDWLKNNEKYNVGTKSMSSKEKKLFLLSLSDEHFIKK